MTISFPIAFWSGTLVTDIAGVRTQDPFWFRMSVFLIAMGSLTGLAASIFGAIDYYTIALPPKPRRLATLHGIGSLLALVVFPLAFALRFGNHASSLGIACTALGTIVLLFAGYWGSELAMKHGVGMG